MLAAPYGPALCGLFAVLFLDLLHVLLQEFADYPADPCFFESNRNLESCMEFFGNVDI